MTKGHQTIYLRLFVFFFSFSALSRRFSCEHIISSTPLKMVRRICETVDRVTRAFVNFCYVRLSRLSMVFYYKWCVLQLVIHSPIHIHEHEQLVPLSFLIHRENFGYFVLLYRTTQTWMASINCCRLPAIEFSASLISENHSLWMWVRDRLLNSWTIIIWSVGW